MGVKLTKIIDNLYISGYGPASDKKLLDEIGITHIVCVMGKNTSMMERTVEGMIYLNFSVLDNASEPIAQHFAAANTFIHEARINGRKVLVHCFAGCSRSVTIATAYIMSVTEHNWPNAMNVIRGVHQFANPNIGFQKQLREFEEGGELAKERRRMKELFPHVITTDAKECEVNIERFREFVRTGNMHGENTMTTKFFGAMARLKQGGCLDELSSSTSAASASDVTSASAASSKQTFEEDELSGTAAEGTAAASSTPNSSVYQEHDAN